MKNRFTTLATQALLIPFISFCLYSCSDDEVPATTPSTEENGNEDNKEPEVPSEKYVKIENLNRGLVAFRESESNVILSWRYLTSDDIKTSFNIYRNGEKIANVPENQGTFYSDKYQSDKQTSYEVKAVVDGKELDKLVGSCQLAANSPIGYLNIPLDRPASATTPAGESYDYSPNDASICDVDGDGEFEIILKWNPSNAHDNSHDGFTGKVYVDCYKLNGQKLWRIDLGRNIRAGAHYTQFLAYDFNCDNKAEVIMKTADGTVDGTGKVIGDAKLDYREGVGSKHPGKILRGKEYLTVFNGQTGAAMKTVDYIPPRGDVKAWGDDYGNRCDRFLATVAYLDGVRPSAVFCRGYYTRTVLAAFDWDGANLNQRWVFDSGKPGWDKFSSQGNHNLRVGDVDGDGFDEIVYGSCTIDHDGKGLYSTGLGHGDAIHMTQFAPSLKGLQVWDCHENKKDGSTFRDAATGRILYQLKSTSDVGRCMAADIDPTTYGVEMWSSHSGGIRDFKGNVVKSTAPGLSCNMAVWWDGDLSRELLDKNVVSKYDSKAGQCTPLIVFEGTVSNNGTKANPCLQADILGDWREEVLMRSEDNTSLRLYVTPIPTPYRFHTFLEDKMYRTSVASENVGYNQPTQPGFYFGTDLKEGIFRGYKFSE